MIKKIKLINTLNIAKIFFLLFVASLFFQIRYVFPTKDAFQTGAYSDFTSISLYLSDIFLFFAVFFAFLPRGVAFLSRGRSLLPRGVNFLAWIKGKINILWLLVFWLILGLIWHFRTLSEINWWFFFKYIELFVAYETANQLFVKASIKQAFLQFFVFFTSFQSILAIFQFFLQKSLGFGKIGENTLSPVILGVAKIVSGGTTYIRGYGTFPHPNLLSAFICVGVLLLVYLFLKAKTLSTRIFYTLAIFLNIFGLTVTFSRGAFLALAFGLVFFFGLQFFRKNRERNESKNQVLAAIIVIIAIISAGVSFKPFLLARATVSDQASLERIFYAKTAWKMIKSHPIFGVGIGESVIHMQQYASIKLWPWQIQPAHNYFILAAAELGIPGALLLAWLLLSHLWALRKIKNDFGFLLASLLIIFLVLMQFDHYFYTLQQTQMLLWIFLGIIAAQTKTPRMGE